MDVTLKQLRALAATVDAGTIVGAAERLHVTPPAVSQQLRLLERASGLPLIERTADGARATDAGRELIEASARIDAELSRCSRAIEAIRSGTGGRVVFAAVSTAKYVAPIILAAFWAEHPDVEVQLAIGNRTETIELLRSGDVDLAMMGRPPADLDLVTERIAEHPHVIIAAPDHPLVGRRDLSITELLDQRFMVREPGSGTRMLHDELFWPHDIEPPVGLEMSSNETIKQAVIAGLGIAVISAHTIAAELDDRRLAVLDVSGLPAMRSWQLLRRSDHQPLPTANALWRFLADRAAEFLPAVPVSSPST